MALMKMLVSDVDGTLLGDAAATRAFGDWWRANGSSARLVYTSGRFVDSIATSVLEHGLPAPDAIIGGVGTEILDCKAKLRDLEWERRWWPSWDRDTVVNALSTFRELELQPDWFQSAGKVSYYLRGGGAEELLDIRCAIADCGIVAEIIYSSGRDLDILPHGVNKGAAAGYLARRWSIDAAEVVACGDSGNDLSLFRQGFSGIVVANAQAELRSGVGREAFFATQPYAAGVVEGLCQWRGCPVEAGRYAN
jgi:mannosylfructose-6-phosphate phosphatase